MFFGLMAWIFWRKGERLNKLVAVLTAIISLEYVKDFTLISMDLFDDAFLWNAMTSIDMIAVPLYAFILRELITPDRLSLRTIVVQELPFVVTPVVYILTREEWVFRALAIGAALYGTYYLVWSMIHIPRYNRHLKELYSYKENVSLNWLTTILCTFYVILGIWTLDCFVIHTDIECVYAMSNLVMWMFIAYFIYRHESVISELEETPTTTIDAAECSLSALGSKIDAYLVQEKAFLNPRLKLSDVAQAVGSNRTYVSNYFNRELSTTFYDYVNALRLDYACELLQKSKDSLYAIAIQSGFNSLSTFHRVFSKSKDATPTEYRKNVTT